MKRQVTAILVISIALLAAGAPSRAVTKLKLATLVPDGSVWDKVLKNMAAEWNRRTEGRVALTIYPGGVAGDEPAVVTKMRIGQLHVAAVTVTGLSEIDPYFRVFQIPRFFSSYDELFFVLERLEPLLRQRLEAKGFVFLNWGHAGWVHLFSKSPIRTLDDLKKQKLFVWAGDDEMVQWWKRSGFQPVALASTDIMMGLQTRMIEVLPTTPLIGMTMQWFRQTPYMHGLGLAPLIGATIATDRAWRRISAEDRASLMAAAREAEERLEAEVPEQDRKAIAEMEKRGLKVTTSTDEAEWQAAAEEFARTMRGAIVPEEIFERALAERDAYRNRGAERAE